MPPSSTFLACCVAKDPWILPPWAYSAEPCEEIPYPYLPGTTHHEAWDAGDGPPNADIMPSTVGPGPQIELCLDNWNSSLIPGAFLDWGPVEDLGSLRKGHPRTSTLLLTWLRKSTWYPPGSPTPLRKGIYLKMISGSGIWCEACPPISEYWALRAAVTLIHQTLHIHIYIYIYIIVHALFYVTYSMLHMPSFSTYV